MVRDSWKQIYPKDCYSQMLIISGETGVSFPRVVNILVREGLISIGKLPKETSRVYLLTNQPPPLTEKEIRELDRVRGQFKRVEAEFEMLKPKAQQYWTNKAHAHPELEEAQAIVEKANPSKKR